MKMIHAVVSFRSKPTSMSLATWCTRSVPVQTLLSSGRSAGCCVLCAGLYRGRRLGMGTDQQIMSLIISLPPLWLFTYSAVFVTSVLQGWSCDTKTCMVEWRGVMYTSLQWQVSVLTQLPALTRSWTSSFVLKLREKTDEKKSATCIW